jgi:anthranilate/para-aminobenzoate synthase component I
MEIIDELEPVPRSVYTGGIGWIDFDNEMDIAMAIRTALLKDGYLRLNVGGGIVADSVPEDEYDETMLKAQSFLEVMGIDLNGSNY